MHLATDRKSQNKIFRPNKTKQNFFKKPLSGILLINKTKECTSHDIVQIVRRILRQKAVGHAGTLDPLAHGLLVILLGQATKLSSYLLNNDKRYTLQMRFGLVTDTFDRTGKILKNKPVRLQSESIKKVLRESTKDLPLPVPCFSAVKVKGKRLYSYARAGQTVTLPIKTMSFYDLSILDIKKDTASVSLSCSKGSYMRSWVHFVGQKLGTGACLMELTRDSSFPFRLSESLTLEELEKRLKESGLPEREEDLKKHFKKSFLMTGEALPYPFLELTGRDSHTLSKGQIPGFLIEKTLSLQIEANKTKEKKIIQVGKEGRLLGLLEIVPFQKIKILKNFPLV